MGVTYNNGRAKVVGDNMELFNSNIDLHRIADARRTNTYEVHIARANNIIF